MKKHYIIGTLILCSILTYYSSKFIINYQSEEEYAQNIQNAIKICLDHYDFDKTHKNMSLSIYKNKLDHKGFMESNDFNFWVFDKDYEHCVSVFAYYKQYLKDLDARKEYEDKKLVNSIKERK
jgi:hypothetical protein